MQGTWIQSLSQENGLEWERATHSNILAWKIHSWRSLAGYSPWGHKESSTTEWLNDDKEQTGDALNPCVPWYSKEESKLTPNLAMKNSWSQVILPSLG